jgi:hypothetical protein
MSEILQKARAYELQHMFYSDVWFLQHCVRVLLEDGRLKEPSPAQRKALTTLIVNV